MFHDQGHTTQDAIWIWGDIEEARSSRGLGELLQVAGDTAGMKE
jgi:hypothetical protein